MNVADVPGETILVVVFHIELFVYPRVLVVEWGLMVIRKDLHGKSRKLDLQSINVSLCQRQVCYPLVITSSV